MRVRAPDDRFVAGSSPRGLSFVSVITELSRREGGVDVGIGFFGEIDWWPPRDTRRAQKKMGSESEVLVL
jgi:hypothetical protein